MTFNCRIAGISEGIDSKVQADDAEKIGTGGRTILRRIEPKSITFMALDDLDPRHGDEDSRPSRPSIQSEDGHI